MAGRDGASGSTFRGLCFALGITAVIYVVSSALGEADHQGLAILVILLSSVWAAWDSHRLQMRRYKTRVETGPVLLFLMLLFLWLVFFPWYLYARYNITHGRTPLRDQRTIEEIFE